MQPELKQSNRRSDSWTQCTSYYDNKSSKKRITINQGGTRSGKTHSIVQVLCEWCYFNRNAGWIITVVRKTLPSLKGSAYRDFIKIVNEEGWYSEMNHNKSEMTYTLFGNLIEFISVDQPQKIRGRKRNVCFINEANELSYEDFFQLNIRTTDKIIIDYNPSDEFHWIYDKLETRSDADFFITTYKDNPFLEKELVNEIERLESADENHWRVYGLGLKGASRDTVYTHWKLCDDLPSRGELFMGQDFGYNVPSALVLCEFYEGAIYVKELIYETKLTTSDLIERYKELSLGRNIEIYCDSAEPKTIEELRRAGYNTKESDKDVTEGIRKVKSMPLYITKDSFNILKEIKSYKWKTDVNGKQVKDKDKDEPVKFNDHAMDAIRYAVFTKLFVPKFVVAVA
jgi:phage terminase large subunit